MSSPGGQAERNEAGMLPEPRALLAACPTATALVDRDGRVVHANERFWGHLAPGTAAGCRLHDLVDDPGAVVDELLARWAGSGSPLPGTLTFPRARTESRHRVDGAVVAGSALILLHCQPRSAATRPFAALTSDMERRNLQATQEQLEQALADLEHSNHVLRSMNAELDDYASIVSHDLRSPLYTIAAFAEDLRSTYGDTLPDDALEGLAAILRTSRRALDLLGAVLRLARLEVGGPTDDAHDADAACRDALEQLSSQILEADGVVEVDGRLPALRVEPVHLALVIQNLVGNAIRFRSPDRRPRITIRGATHEGRATIEVRDNGIGIAEDRLEQVFAPFERGRPAVGEPGTGIGLTTCRKIVERYGGSIAARPADGAGTVITLDLPAAEPGQMSAHRVR